MVAPQINVNPFTIDGGTTYHFRKEIRVPVFRPEQEAVEPVQGYDAPVWLDDWLTVAGHALHEHMAKALLEGKELAIGLIEIEHAQGGD